MTLFDFIRLLYRNFGWLLSIPIIMGLLVFFLTMNQAKEYGVSSLVYTGIASGYNIESGEGDKVDYHSVNNAFDNLIAIVKSQQTFEEVGIRLLSQHLVLEASDGNIINQGNFDLLQEAFPKSSINQYRVAGNRDSTVLLLMKKYLDNDKLLVNILRGGSSPYSMKKLNGIEVKRHKSSDMLSLYFASNDPGIAQQTMLIFIEVFSRRYKEIKDGETGNVVAYFERELRNAKKSLSVAEDKLTDFRVNSRVINYGEQTKAIAIKKQNALEEYAKKNMNKEATQSAVVAIEERLKVREDILSKNSDILEKKKHLEELTTQMALIQSSGDDSLIQIFMEEQQKIKQSIEEDVSTLYLFSNSKEGLPSKQLLNDWLNNVIQLNREKVNVDLYQQRLVDIDQLYDHFAPLGSTIARLEREINVFEQTYLQILHGLNMAKLRQQNIEMMSNLEVIDWPRYPHEPKAGKRSMLLAIAVFIGFFGALSVIVAADLLDGSLKKPEKAAGITGLKVLGAFPTMEGQWMMDNPKVVSATAGIFAGKLSSELHAVATEGQKIVSLMSLLPEQGKSIVGDILLKELKLGGEKVALLKSSVQEGEEHPHTYTYEPDAAKRSVTTVQQLVPQVDLSVYDTVLLELPAYNQGIWPVKLVEQSSLSLIICTANKSWQPSYKAMTEDIEQLTSKKPMLVLNAVRTYHLDQLLGEVPIQRSNVIQKIRALARFEFSAGTIKLF